VQKRSTDVAREPRPYEEPAIVEIGALHELTLNKAGGDSDYMSHQPNSFPSGTS
jgi:hypothetical protein